MKSIKYLFGLYLVGIVVISLVIDDSLIVYLPISLIVALIWYILYKNLKVEKSRFAKETHSTFLNINHNKGVRGEYLTYKELEPLEKYGAKFLFNVYVPKSNGETTEIDSIMINSDGIFVLESKNYSGTIYGNPEDSYWTHEIPTYGLKNRVEKFYNPIKQNNAHIVHLARYLNRKNVNYYSVLAFDDECVLGFDSRVVDNTYVIYRRELMDAVTAVARNNDAKLSPAEIETLYNDLKPLTEVSRETKEKHIENIKKYKNTMLA